MTTWYEGEGYDLDQRPFLRPPGPEKEDVRPFGSFAETCAIGLATGALSNVPGLPPLDVVRSRTIRMLTAVALSNRANGGNWGGSRPGTHGTASTNVAAPAMLAAWLLWPALSPEQQAYVVNMARFEVDSLMDVPVRYLRDRAGRTVGRPDSAAEELAWNEVILSLAVNMFPDHPRRRAWEQRIARSTLAAWARPADVESPARYHGLPLSEWVDGSNLNPDGTLANGGIAVHPFYMTALANSVFQLAPYALAGRPGLNVVRFNADAVYQALVNNRYRVADGYEPPGGTMYIPGSPDIYFPLGSNKSPVAFIAFGFLDWVAGQLGADARVQPKASEWERRHVERALAMRGVRAGRPSLTGAAGVSDDEYWVAYWGARAHLMSWLSNQVGFPLHDFPLGALPRSGRQKGGPDRGR